MEDGLDSVEEGAVEWKALIGDFYKGLMKALSARGRTLRILKRKYRRKQGRSVINAGQKLL
jgi:DNA topoisomerase IA